MSGVLKMPLPSLPCSYGCPCDPVLAGEIQEKVPEDFPLREKGFAFSLPSCLESGLVAGATAATLNEGGNMHRAKLPSGENSLWGLDSTAQPCT